MQSRKRGFTLIELLVVVLIIGILAAVAVPQYQVAVLKSRYATLKNLTDSIARAQEIYYMSNGDYAAKFEDLDVELPSGKLNTSTQSTYYYPWGNCSLFVAGKAVRCEHTDSEIAYHRDYSGSAHCLVNHANRTSLQAKMCAQETQDNLVSHTLYGQDYKYK